MTKPLNEMDRTTIAWTLNKETVAVLKIMEELRAKYHVSVSKQFIYAVKLIIPEIFAALKKNKKYIFLKVVECKPKDKGAVEVIF